MPLPYPSLPMAKLAHYNSIAWKNDIVVAIGLTYFFMDGIKLEESILFAKILSFLKNFGLLPLLLLTSPV
jgi:hypothetical protein